MERRGITMTGVGITIFAAMLAGAIGGTGFVYVRTSGIERDYRSGRTDYDAMVGLINEVRAAPAGRRRARPDAPAGFDLAQAVNAAAAAVGLTADQIQRAETQPDRTHPNGWTQRTIVVHLGGQETNPLERQLVERLIDRIETEHAYVVTIDLQIQLVDNAVQRNTRVTFATFTPPVPDPPP